MIKFSHSIFALPYAVLATFMAAASAVPPTFPSWLQIGLIVVCMVAARSTAMTFNRIVDAAIDARNARTAQRAIPQGRISIRAAWAFFAAGVLVFLLGCAAFAWFLKNPWPLRLSAPVVMLLCFYSYTKRFTRFSHLVLGIVIAMAPVAAWIAISPATLGAPAWLLMCAVACWIAGFDIIYACQDVDFDRGAGLYSLPARIGVGPALWAARALHAVTVVALVGVGITGGLGVLYYCGAAAAAILLVVENAIVHPNDLRRVNLAFFTVNGVVGLVLGILGALDVCLRVTRT
ncbi:MAG: UbiA family prenyltransferase [Planctomycetes bacterium]|nr:UbiA family prenyltransferase [Planctomycetota bacterium]